jgi:hypothetical protein
MIDILARSIERMTIAENRTIEVLNEKLELEKMQTESDSVIYNLKKKVVWLEDKLAGIEKISDESIKKNRLVVSNLLIDQLKNKASELEKQLEKIKPKNEEVSTESIIPYPLKEAINKADRFNEGKLKWSLVDFDSLEDMVKVLEFGAKKYGCNNWKKGLKTTEIVESLLRHTTAYIRCEDVDSESKISHIGHIMCNAMFLSYMNKYKPEFDSRIIDENKPK